MNLGVIARKKVIVDESLTVAVTFILCMKDTTKSSFIIDRNRTGYPRLDELMI